MTRSEFLEKLKTALGNDLSGAIIQENVNYYNNYISEEVDRGRSEEEVIDELGDPWVLAQTIIDSAEGRNTVNTGYEKDYDYDSDRDDYGNDYGRQQRSDRRVYSFGFGSWWQKLLFLLGIVGVIMIVVAVISGLISLLAPLVIPVAIIIIILRLFRKQ